MEQIDEIKERNRRVELDKAWETSVARRFIIAVITYVVATIWLIVIENEKPFLNALVPLGGYLLSTLSLSFVKKWWIEKQTLL
ncbi:MAG: hypothetical protein WAW13_04500 [Minisyncoccia bacterium]